MHTETRYIKKPSKRALAAIDDRIDRVYRFTCSGIEINVMDISKIFAVGRQAIANSADDQTLCSTIRAYVETIRKN